MSMLAEPRRKQKWTLNPRGKQWSEDSNKFGQKMLEKMGWTSGKGLGVNEQGMTEHVRVSFKNDAAGIGFKKDDLDKAWTEHQDSFNDLLQQLQKGQCRDITQTEEGKNALSGKSLELKSKQSRARVHYQKFTRGKDVNKYSLKDIANIFGRKELNLDENSKENQSINLNSSDPDPLGTQDNRTGVITINSGNMVDYFMKKSQNFSLTPKSKEWQETNSESDPDYAGFGFASALSNEQFHRSDKNKDSENACNYAFENPCLRFSSPKNISNFGSGFKSSKKRKISDDNELSLNDDSKKFKDDANENIYKNDFVNDVPNLECPANEVWNRKKFEVDISQLGVTNSALDLSDEVNDKKRVTFNDHVEYSIDSVKRKKERATLDKFEVENKKSKKKKKQVDNVNKSVSSGFVNEALDVEEIPEELNDNEINERKSRKSKKGKRNRRPNLETIVEISEEDKEACEDGTATKRLKVENGMHDNSIPQENLSNKKAEKKKKKKKKEKVEEKFVTAGKNDTEENTEKQVTTEIKTGFEEEEYELYKLKDQETFAKEMKKQKKKNIKLNVEKHEDIIPEIKAEVNGIEHTEKEVEKTEEEIVELKRKKKVKRDVDANDTSTKIVSMKHEFSDKENANSERENTSKTTKPEKKKYTNSIRESINSNGDSTHHMEFRKEKPIEQTNISTKSTNTPPKCTRNETFNILSSPWNQKAKMSKKLLKSLFHRNSIVHFPGSNVHEIKGYGADVQ